MYPPRPAAGGGADPVKLDGWRSETLARDASQPLRREVTGAHNGLAQTGWRPIATCQRVKHAYQNNLAGQDRANAHIPRGWRQLCLKIKLDVEKATIRKRQTVI